MFIENPLGHGLEKIIANDLVRGYVFTEAKIGMLTHPYDETLLQNRTLLYHIIGNVSGEWQVPVGGMGSLAAELERVARGRGTEFRLSTEVLSITPDKEPAVKFIAADGTERTAHARWVLCNAAPAVLAKLLPGYRAPETHQGAVFKINMLLKKLPKPKAGSVSPEDAFAGTFHVDEGYEDMKASFAAASKGDLPERPPGEMYCHTLTDDSILSEELRGRGYQTLTFFGLDTPYELFKKDNEGIKARALELYLRGINSALEEPIEECLALDGEGRPCLEAKSPVDIEKELNMPLGNIFHGDLAWPFAENEAEVGQWGVETGFDNILICGSGARRGGAVSGIPGHNAAQKILGAGRD
jgi:phytoene dehydrogenase-like protein